MRHTGELRPSFAVHSRTRRHPPARVTLRPSGSFTITVFGCGPVSNEHRPLLELYGPILIFLAAGVGIGVVVLCLSFVISLLLGSRRPDADKLSPYECGFEAFEDARMKFDVRYYLVAILFIIFDLEIAFLFPWAVALDQIGLAGFLAMMVFLAVLVVGFVYEWKKGALEWE